MQIGYELGADQRTCLDVDECLENNGGCDQICLNDVGSHSCNCHSGFRLLSDEMTCLDVDECSEIENICGHGDCVNFPGTYNCECHEGFTKEAGICTDINECDSKIQICGENGLCENLEG